MANFTTHIAVGTVVSGTLATLTLAANVISHESLVAVTLAGVLGSVLPDIDLKDSRPSQALFSGLAVFFSFCVLFTIARRYSIAEMWIVWLGTLFLVRYGVQALFYRFSYHRGIWHSIVAGLFFAFLTAIVFTRFLGQGEGAAWLAGGFMFIGYLTHLVLDELYSVDVADRRLKASFGSALKLVDAKRPGDSAALLLASVLLLGVVPQPRAFIDGISSGQLWAGLQQRLLPHDKWFGLIGVMTGAAANAPHASEVTTGSIDVSPAAAAPAADEPSDAQRP